MAVARSRLNQGQTPGNSNLKRVVLWHGWRQFGRATIFLRALTRPSRPAAPVGIQNRSAIFLSPSYR
jgi:hypothetical protein